MIKPVLHCLQKYIYFMTFMINSLLIFSILINSVYYFEKFKLLYNVSLKQLCNLQVVFLSYIKSIFRWFEQLSCSSLHLKFEEVDLFIPALASEKSQLRICQIIPTCSKLALAARGPVLTVSYNKWFTDF